jgi:hypothetical protein
VTDVFEAPLSFLMTPANFKREKANWKGPPTHVHALRFELHKIWGVTANIHWNLRERLYTDR